MKFQILASIVTGLSLVSASPVAEALPWAQANPQAAAAANAYADAYAEAVALAHPDPEAYALAASADDCASISCHASCGLLIIEAQSCSQNKENSYSGPYNQTCLCSSDSKFIQYYSPCMDCGWTLWKYYGVYVTSALEACKTLSTEPTGTSRCSTTLEGTYTPDYNIQGCSYLGNCESTTSAAAAAESSAEQSTSTSAAASSTAAEQPTTSAAAQETSSTAQQASSTGAAQTSSAAETTSEQPSQAVAPTSEAQGQSSAAAAGSSEAQGSAVVAQSSSASAGAGASSTPVVQTFEAAAVKVGATSAVFAILFSLLF
ncbi:unnamed protein product [Wickerhamomyces anomalus]